MTISPTPRQARRPTGYLDFAGRYPKVIERVQLLRGQRRESLIKLTALTGRKQHGEVRKLLRSRNLHFLYAFDALLAKRLLREATPETITELATRCNPFAPVVERVVVRTITKSGKTRHIHDFGPLKRMHQLLVADVLRALHPPRQDQFLFNGGMPMALGAIEDAFRGGDLYAAELDVVSFYGRVRHAGLAELLRPLPRAVIDNVVWDIPNRRWIDDDDDDAVVSSALTGASSSGSGGLSLGASTSPVVGETIIGRLLQAALPGTMVAYADNVLVLGREEGDVVLRAEHLLEVAAGLTSGPLELRVTPPVSFRSRNNFVSFAGQWGHAIRHRLDWQPDADKQRHHLVAELEIELSPDEIAKAESKLLHWRRSYMMWRNGDKFVAHQLASLAAIRYYQNAQPEHLIDAQYKLAVALALRPSIQLFELLPEGTTARHRDRRMHLMRCTQHMLDQMAFGNRSAA